LWNFVPQTEGKQWLKVFENRMLKKTFEPKKDEVTRENCIMKSYMS
jgi:hypothetical protein